MLSENVLFAMNDIESNELLEVGKRLGYIEENKSRQLKRHTRRFASLLVAAAVSFLLAATAFGVGYSVYRQRQEELRASYKVDENNLTGYVEYGETNLSSNAEIPQMKIVSSVDRGEFRTVYISISPVTEQEAECILEFGYSYEVLFSVGNDRSEVERSLYLPNESGDFSDEVFTGGIACAPAAIENCYDLETESLLLECSIVSEAVTINWSMPVFMKVILLHTEGQLLPADVDGEYYLDVTSRNMERDYGTEKFTFGGVEYRSFGGLEVLNAFTDEACTVTDVRLQPTGVYFELTADSFERLYSQHSSTDSDFGEISELQLEWLQFYDELLNSSYLIFEDGHIQYLLPANACPYSDGTVSLFSAFGETVNIDSVTGVCVQGIILSANN